MISTLRLLKIWLKGGIPTIEKYEKKLPEKSAWEDVFGVDFCEQGAILNMEDWTLTKRKAALEGLYGQYDQYDVPIPENVSVQDEGLCLSASPASVEGIQWHKDYGFVKAPCEYAGAYVSSLQNLNLKKGMILVCAHWEESEDFLLNAALESDRQIPLIQIVTLSKYWQLGYHDKQMRKVVQLPRFLLKEGNSYVFELQWSEKDIKWKVNGMEILKIRRRIPNDMYFSATIALIRKIQTIQTGNFYIESFRVLEKKRKRK